MYDNEHFGKFLAVVVQFPNVATEFSSGGVRYYACSAPAPRVTSCRRAQELNACCWLSTQGQTAEVHGDARLAVGGNDSTVTVISLAACAAVALLRGHTQVRSPLLAWRCAMAKTVRRASWTLHRHRQSKLRSLQLALARSRFPARPHLLASASKDGTVRLWNLDTGDCTRVISAPGVTCIALQVRRQTDMRVPR